MSYQLYVDSAHVTVWGDGSTGSGLQQAINVYATVPSQGMPQPGTYQDTVTTTITF